MKITFPNKTAKEIVEECNNKLGKGKLLFDTDWYENQDFYTKEKCRPRTMEVSDSIEHYGMNWNNCKTFLDKEGRKMLNFAEYVWFIKCYFEKHGKYTEENEYKWSWTSSRSSRGNLVGVGNCDADGVWVFGDGPVYSYSSLGVRFFRGIATRGAKAGQAEADSRNLEARLSSLEDDMEKIKKLINI